MRRFGRCVRRAVHHHAPVTRARVPALPDLPPDLPDRPAGGELLEDEATVEGVALSGSAGDLHARLLTLAECRITARLAGARLPELHLRGCVVAGADLANVHAERATLHRTEIRDARLTGATLAQGVLRDVTFGGCRADLVGLAGATLERVAFTDCDLHEASLDEAQLRDVRFERCVLDGASLHRVRLQRVELLDCDLSGVRSVGDLRGAAMRWGDVVANAGPLARAAGITILTDEDES